MFIRLLNKLFLEHCLRYFCNQKLFFESKINKEIEEKASEFSICLSQIEILKTTNFLLAILQIILSESTQPEHFVQYNILRRSKNINLRIYVMFALMKYNNKLQFLNQKTIKYCHI